jgi:MFS family permease
MTSTGKRLLPLYAAGGLQGFMLWTPVEKLFMNEIGFDAAAVGVMAAAYAAVTPLAEIPSGILADRWSRRGVLMLANLSLAASVLVGALSHDVPTYIAGAMLLGVYFALTSGTVDSIIYDAVLEETGSSDDFSRLLGRARIVESASLAASSLAGGWLAAVASTRTTYFLSVPFVLASVLMLVWFREPRLHRAAGRESLRAHVAVTFRTLTRRGRLLPVVALAVLTALITSMLFEFGPLWLVALRASPVAYGPFWAALVSTLGLGGLVVTRLKLDRTATLAGVTLTMAGAGVVLTASHHLLVIAAAQVVLALLAVVLGIHVAQLLHDSVPSTVRAGVSSGVGTFSWGAFLPVSLVFGVVSRDHGVYVAGWLVVGAALATGAALFVAAHATRKPAAPAAQPAPCPEPVVPCPEPVLLAGAAA